MKKILTQYGVCALAVALMVTLAQAQTPAPGTSFRDCSNGCPEMVVVQQGRFTMGAPAGEEARENLPNGTSRLQNRSKMTPVAGSGGERARFLRQLVGFSLIAGILEASNANADSGHRRVGWNNRRARPPRWIARPACGSQYRIRGGAAQIGPASVRHRRRGGGRHYRRCRT